MEFEYELQTSFYLVFYPSVFASANPWRTDTDDGVLDFIEIQNGTNPNNRYRWDKLNDKDDSNFRYQ